MFFFKNNADVIVKQDSIDYAYLLVLGDDLERAARLFANFDSPRSKWGVVLCEILSGCIIHFPTYFEIRNFLEIDIDFLLQNKKIDYLELLLGSSEVLSEINPETYKFISRVMLENNILDSAILYMKKYENICYKDPELHFLYCKYYLKRNEYKNALNSIGVCLCYFPDYYPGIKQKEYILKMIADNKDI